MRTPLSKLRAIPRIIHTLWRMLKRVWTFGYNRYTPRLARLAIGLTVLGLSLRVLLSAPLLGSAITTLAFIFWTICSAKVVIYKNRKQLRHRFAYTLAVDALLLVFWLTLTLWMLL